jgi:RNA polymerase sigma-70 factor (ECF subfamily)
LTDAGDRDRSFRDEALPEMEAVYRFALRLTRDPEQARDLTQDTFLRAYQNWEKYVPGTRVKSWLFTICRNLFLRGEDRNRRHGEIVRDLTDEDPRNISREATVFLAAADRDPEGSFWAQVVDREILKEIDALPPEFREAIVLSDVEGLAYAEVAEILGVPVGTVKSRLFRGRRILQEKLYDYAVSTGVVRPKASASATPGGGDEGR